MPYYLSGEEPDLIGKQCTGLVLQHFYEVQKITDQVNVAYLRFSERWYRLYFECCTIFWRESEAPSAPENSSEESGLLLNDLSDMDTVVGHVVQAVRYGGSRSGDVRAWIGFANGKTLLFAYSHASDSTRLVLVPSGR